MEGSEEDAGNTLQLHNKGEMEQSDRPVIYENLSDQGSGTTKETTAPKVYRRAVSTSIASDQMIYGPKVKLLRGLKYAIKASLRENHTAQCP